MIDTIHHSLSLIVAMGQNRVIGDGREMPWHIPSDLRYFKEKTLGKPVIIGRKTFASLLCFYRSRFNIPPSVYPPPEAILPGRSMIILSRRSRNDEDIYPGGLYAQTPEEALNIARQKAQKSTASEIMVIGGGEIYRIYIDIADTLYVTYVATSPKTSGGKGVTFPPIDPERWQEIMRLQIPAHGQDAFDTCRVIYKRL